MIRTILAERSLVNAKEASLKCLFLTARLCCVQAVKQFCQTSQNCCAKFAAEDPGVYARNQTSKILGPATPMLSHKGSREAVKSWPRQQVIAIAKKEILAPLRLPDSSVQCRSSFTFVFGPPNKLMGNNHKMLAEFDWNTPPQSSCSLVKRHHPEAQMVKHPSDDAQTCG